MPQSGPQYSQQKTVETFSPDWLLMAIVLCLFIFVSVVLPAAFSIREPSGGNYYVENACLIEFNLTGKNLLQYNLKLDVSITNPNKKCHVYYQQLQASASYEGEIIASALLPTFRLEHKKTVVIHPAFGGQSAIGLDDLSVNEFMKQRSDGFFRINVEINAKMIESLGLLTTDEFSASIWCGLTIPLLPSNSSASGNGGFTRTECEVKTLI
ncbi:NDR1/HIN1-like protein 10 [Nymphaea colorata]|uniref:Uncharacterized protein n=1 Tax=Nymphaea colorata TaxID=210225 RepID=A0A5K1A295_9MAGN|nr:NDR1/HIN1-like protein 10 [Nymphaea colorata]